MYLEKKSKQKGQVAGGSMEEAGDSKRAEAQCSVKKKKMKSALKAATICRGKMN